MRRYGPEEVCHGVYRGRWGPDGTFVWRDNKGRRVQFPSSSALIAPPKAKLVVEWKGKKKGRKPRAEALELLSENPSPKLAASRRRDEKQWERSMDACMERIHTSLWRSKRLLGALSNDFLSGGIPVHVSLDPSCNDDPLDPSVLMGPTDWPKKEWEFTPLPDADLSPPNSIGVRGRDAVNEWLGRGIESNPVKANHANKGQGGGSERGRSKNLKVKISNEVYLDRLLC